MTIREYLDLKKTSKDEEVLKEIEKLEAEYEKIRNDIVTICYRYRDFVIYHVIIPSVNKDRQKVTYDVVIEVKTLRTHEGDPRIDKVAVRVFSNCPSFTFGHAHDFYKRGLICDWLMDKYAKQVKDVEPTEEHKPKNDLEKSLYLSLLHIDSEGMDAVSTYHTIGKKVDSLIVIKRDIRSQQEITDHIKERVKQNKKDQQLKEEPKSDEPKGNTRKSGTVPKVVKTKKTPKTKHTPTNSLTTEKAKRTKKTKRI